MKRLFNKGTVFCAAAVMYAALAVYYVACKFAAPQECRLCKMTPNGCDKEEEASTNISIEYAEAMLKEQSDDDGRYGTNTTFPEVTWEVMPYNFFLIKDSTTEEPNHDDAL